MKYIRSRAAHVGLSGCFFKNHFPMPVPDFQTLMLPLLKSAADGKEHTQAEAISALAKDLKLSEEELKETRPNTSQTVFDNRIAWAKFHMKKAGLFVFPRRAIFQITDSGKQVLVQNPPKIGVAFLKQFPDYLEFIGGVKSEIEKGASKTVRPETMEENSTPEEVLEKGYRSIRKAVASDLLERTMGISPARFEQLVIDLLVRMGYGGGFKDAGAHSGKSGDEGIDGTIREDKLGLDMIYIQAKRWKTGNVVGRPEIQKFVGALAGQGAKKGIFITTSTFTKEARDYAPKNETKIVLIDGSELAELMMDYNVGVSVANTYEIKRVDSDYFGDE